MDRLLREARAASQLDHPNIARVFEAGTTDDGRLFFVMEYVEGETLASELARGPLAPQRAREVLSQVLAALAHAHSHQIIHRDIKPANIILAASGVKVLDFGLAKQLPEAAAVAAAQSATVTWTDPSTQSGIIMGTPAYMSPEQLAGTAADPRLDVFACGVVLYQCLSGRLPFAGSGPVLYGAILHAEPDPLPTADPQLAAVALRALRKNPQDRFQSASEMAAALRSDSSSTLTQVRPSPRPSRKLWIAAAISILLLAIAAWATRPAPVTMAPAAQRWYQQGLAALRDGTYYSAARAFEEVTRADPAFALGHARLAEAWSELDSLEKAQRELLLARRNTTGWRRRAPEVEYTLAAIEGLVLRDFPAAAESYRRLLAETPGEDQAPIWLDIGRAQLKMNENAAAFDSFSTAISRDPSHAAGWLLRGIVQGNRQQFGPSAEDFSHARQIYEASQNFEGQAELEFQQGRFSNMAKDLPAARASLTRALDLANKSSDEFHQIRATSQLSIVTYMEGDATTAQTLAESAVARARAARMPYLTVQGLVDLGNTQLSRLDLPAAEATLRQALALAVSDGLQRSEMRTRMSLGSVLVQAGRDDEAVPELNAALAFYTKGQSRMEIQMGRLLLGRVYRRRGEFPKVQTLLAESLKDATAAGDKAGIDMATGEIANLYSEEERYVEALKQYEKRVTLLRDSKVASAIGYSLTGQASMAIRLGDMEKGKTLLEEAARRGGVSESVAGRIASVRRESLYRSGDWNACASAYEEALRKEKPTADEGMMNWSRCLECLMFAGKGAEANRLAAPILPKAQSMPNSHGAMRLRAVAALAEPDARKALASLEGPLNYFRKREQFESLWMAEAIASAVSRRAGDSSQSATHEQAGATAWDALQVRLGPEHRARYSSLAAVRQYRKLSTN